MGPDPSPSTCVHLSLIPLRVDVINGWPLMLFRSFFYISFHGLITLSCLAHVKYNNSDVVYVSLNLTLACLFVRKPSLSKNEYHRYRAGSTIID